jgi:hypothetical protein
MRQGRWKRGGTLSPGRRSARLVGILEVEDLNFYLKRSWQVKTQQVVLEIDFIF